MKENTEHGPGQEAGQLASYVIDICMAPHGMNLLKWCWGHSTHMAYVRTTDLRGSAYAAVT